jgi:broad specificity phosphatase PhoE
LTVRLVLICHASTAATREVRLAADDPLDEAGANAARTVAPSFGFRSGARSWCAPSPAARQTAALLGLSPAIEPRLREQDMGTWRGLALAELQRHAPDEVARWLSDPTAAPHGGESLVELLHRVGAWMDSQQEERSQVVAVTHPAVVRAALAVVLAGGTPQSFWRFDVGPLWRAELRGNDGRWNLRAFTGPSGD